jgi:FAD/FMN-containing dehydrogenase
VRGGGHNIAGLAACDDGVMLDLSLMNAVRVDPASRTARVEGGATLHDYDHETQAFGLAGVGGTVSHTGVAGLTLGGGFGWLARKFGLAVDNLLSVDIVTADGQFLTASATQNPDLFWGVRGGGGNFGVVTSFEFRVHQVGPMVTGGLALFPLSQAREVLELVREFNATGPDELSVAAVGMTAPPAPFVPGDYQGAKMIAIGLCHCGSLEDGANTLARIRSQIPPVVDLLGPIPYTAHQQLLDAANAFGPRYYSKGGIVKQLDESVIEELVTILPTLSAPLSTVILFPMGGAINRVEKSETAYGHREGSFFIDIISGWQEQAEDAGHIKWTREAYQRLESFIGSSTYVNTLNDDGNKGINRAYPPEIYQRLVELKTKYDPTNLFRMNNNIVPKAR